MARLWLGGSLAPQACCTTHRPRPITPTHPGAVSGATSLCDIHKQSRCLCALKKGEKKYGILGPGQWQTAWRSGSQRLHHHSQQILPGPGQISRQRGAVSAPLAPGSCRGPESPHGTALLSGLVPGSPDAPSPYLGLGAGQAEQARGGDVAWEGGCVLPEGGNACDPQGQPAAKATWM